MTYGPDLDADGNYVAPDPATGPDPWPLTPERRRVFEARVAALAAELAATFDEPPY